MVYWKYIRPDEVTGGNVHSDKVIELLEELTDDIYINNIHIHGGYREEEWNQSLNFWSYHIYINDKEEHIWLSCNSRKVYDKIYDDVMNFKRVV